MAFDSNKLLNLNQSILFLIFTFYKIDKISIKHNSERTFNLKTQK